MLLWLAIHNFVLLDSLEIDFEPGLTVLTGETGAGKSILLDAIGLILGDRFDKRQLREGANKIELAAGFKLTEDSAALAWLTEQDYLDDDEPTTLTIRRTQDTANKNRIWINGRNATVAQLADLGATLIELHGQHAHQTLSHTPTQRQWLDDFAGTQNQVEQVGELWRHWQSARQALENARAAQGNLAAERELLQQRHADLAALAVEEGEWDSLSQRQRQLSHVDALLEVAQSGQLLLEEADDAIVSQLAALVQKLRAEGDNEPAFAELATQVDNAAIELEEVARSLRDFLRHIDADPQTLAEVEARISALHDTARKYRVRPQELAALALSTEEALAQLEESADLAALERRLNETERAYRQQADRLSDARRRAAKKMNQAVSAALNELAMPGGRFEAVVSPAERPDSHGADKIEFCISAHPGQAIGPLAQIASGGELSRIALALLTVLAETVNVPTLIFDEIDTGVGGATGHAIGQRLRALGKSRQVLCVTHLPQVAACAHHHLRVSKEGQPVTTTVVPLTQNQRVEELARMLGGATITAKTRAHARELLGQSTEDR